MGHSALSSPAARAQQSAHTTLDMTNECLLPCPLDMPFAPLLRFVDSALGVIGWAGALDWIAFVDGRWRIIEILAFGLLISRKMEQSA